MTSAVAVMPTRTDSLSTPRRRAFAALASEWVVMDTVSDSGRGAKSTHTKSGAKVGDVEDTVRSFLAACLCV